MPNELATSFGAMPRRTITTASSLNWGVRIIRTRADALVDMNICICRDRTVGYPLIRTTSRCRDPRSGCSSLRTTSREQTGIPVDKSLNPSVDDRFTTSRHVSVAGG